MQNDDTSRNCISRRDFLKQTTASIAGFTLLGGLLPILESCSTSTEPSVNHGTVTVDVAQLSTDGKGMYVSNTLPEGDQPLMIVRQNATTYLALSSYCPHEGCEVSLPSGGKMVCPCHDSTFSLDGSKQSGPATRSLTKYTTTFDAATKKLTITY